MWKISSMLLIFKNSIFYYIYSWFFWDLKHLFTSMNAFTTFPYIRNILCRASDGPQECACHNIFQSKNGQGVQLFAVSPPVLSPSILRLPLARMRLPSETVNLHSHLRQSLAPAFFCRGERYWFGEEQLLWAFDRCHSKTKVALPYSD